MACAQLGTAPFVRVRDTIPSAKLGNILHSVKEYALLYVEPSVHNER
jgi:hypothetical protein